MATAPDQRIKEAFEKAGYTEALVDRWWHLPQSEQEVAQRVKRGRPKTTKEVEVLALAYAARSGEITVHAERVRTEAANGSDQKPQVRAREFLMNGGISNGSSEPVTFGLSSQVMLTLTGYQRNNLLVGLRIKSLDGSWDLRQRWGPPVEAVQVFDLPISFIVSIPCTCELLGSECVR